MLICPPCGPTNAENRMHHEFTIGNDKPMLRDQPMLESPPGGPMTHQGTVTSPNPPNYARSELRYSHPKVARAPARTRPPPGQFALDCQALSSHSTGAGKHREGEAGNQCYQPPFANANAPTGDQCPPWAANAGPSPWKDQCQSKGARGLANARHRQRRTNAHPLRKSNDVPARDSPRVVQ